MNPTQLTTRRLGLESLEVREVPSVAAGDEPTAPADDSLMYATGTPTKPTHPKRFAVGSGAGQAAQVNVYESGTNALLTTLTPFGRGYTGGTRVATGDLTGDGIDDIAIAAGDGKARVLVIDGATLKTIADLSPLSGGKGGANIAIGDVTGDGRADLVVGAGSSAAVRVIRGQDAVAGNAAAVAAFDAYTGPAAGGVRVAVGDVTGDGRADIVTAPGAGAAPVVRTFAPKAAFEKLGQAKFDVTALTVGGAGDTGGVNVAAADVNGDGKAEIVVGRQVGRYAQVTAFDVSGRKPKAVLSALGFTATTPGGVPVAARDLDGDGRAEVLAGGGDGVSQVRVLGGRGGLSRSFMAFPANYRGGVFVG